MQNLDELVNINKVEIPEGSTLKLYSDNALMKEYSLDEPIKENMTLYAIIGTPVKKLLFLSNIIKNLEILSV